MNKIKIIGTLLKLNDADKKGKMDSTNNYKCVRQDKKLRYGLINGRLKCKNLRTLKWL